MTYWPPNGDGKEFEKHSNKILSADDILKKVVIMAGDFNMNLLDLKQYKEVQNFVNIIFGHNMMLIINKPTDITKKTATSIDHIFINSVTVSKLKTGIIKSEILDHLPIFFVTDYNIHIKETRDIFSAAKSYKKRFRNVFNVWTKSHLSNFEIG